MNQQNGDVPTTITLPVTGAEVVLYNGNCYYKTDRKGAPNVNLSDVTEVFSDCATCVESLVTPTPTVTVTPTPTPTMTVSGTPAVTVTPTPTSTPPEATPTSL